MHDAVIQILELGAGVSIAGDAHEDAVFPGHAAMRCVEIEALRLCIELEKAGSRFRRAADALEIHCHRGPLPDQARQRVRQDGKGSMVHRAQHTRRLLLLAQVEVAVNCADHQIQLCQHVVGQRQLAIFENVHFASLQQRDAIEFFVELVERLGLPDLPPQNERARWPEMRAAFERTFRQKTRDEWVAIFEGSDACFAPVLSFSEARSHPHNLARGSFVTQAKVEQPAPAPRFSATPAAVRRDPPERGAGGRAALAEWGFSAGEIARLRAGGLGFAP